MLRGILCVTILAFAASCHTMKPLATTSNSTGSRVPPPHAAESVKLAPTARTSKRVYKYSQGSMAGSAETMAARNPYFNLTGDIESCSWLQFKYALSMDVPVEALTNQALLSYLDEWYGVPYRYGGSTRAGIDCSAFTAGCLSAVFAISVPRTVKEQYQACRLIDKSELLEGDIVFFNTTGNLSHVGIYLLNNKFMHASTSSGVMISDLNEDYFLRRFAAAGRVKQP